MEIHIEPELRKYMRQLTEDERSLLEASIIAEGVRDPLVVWHRNGELVLLDGHHRYEIAQRHGISFELVELSFPDLSAAKRWAIRNQLGRRNLTPAEVAYYRGQEYLEERRPVGRPQGGAEKLSQNATISQTAEAIASRHGVDRATIHRDAQFAHSGETCMKCFECDKGRLQVRTMEVTTVFRGENISVNARVEACNHCGLQLIRGEDLGEFMRLVLNAHCQWGALNSPTRTR
jgi:hypothetical protein